MFLLRSLSQLLQSCLSLFGLAKAMAKAKPKATEFTLNHHHHINFLGTSRQARKLIFGMQPSTESESTSVLRPQYYQNSQDPQYSVPSTECTVTEDSLVVFSVPRFVALLVPRLAQIKMDVTIPCQDMLHPIPGNAPLYTLCEPEQAEDLQSPLMPTTSNTLLQDTKSLPTGQHNPASQLPVFVSTMSCQAGSLTPSAANT
jgi:hypothetical protein